MDSRISASSRPAATPSGRERLFVFSCLCSSLVPSLARPETRILVSLQAGFGVYIHRFSVRNSAAKRINFF
jgi:hypothetical protein